MNFDAATNDLVANPIPELTSLRTGSLASEKGVLVPNNSIPWVVNGTEAGAASSADVEIAFSAADASEVTFGVCVLANSTNDGLGIRITVTNTSAGYTATVATG